VEEISAHGGRFLRMTTAQDSQRLLWSRADAARLLACSTKTVDREIAAGRLTAVRIGRAVRVTDAEIHRYIDALPSYEPGIGA